MGASPPKQVTDLVERFERDRKVFQSLDRREEQLRKESGPSPSIRHSDLVSAAPFGQCVIRVLPGMPVIHEESIKACPELGRRVAGATKAPDYTFRINRRGLDLQAARGYIDSENVR